MNKVEKEDIHVADELPLELGLPSSSSEDEDEEPELVEEPESEDPDSAGEGAEPGLAALSPEHCNKRAGLPSCF